MYGTPAPGPAGRTIVLPPPAASLTGVEVARLRGQADGLALKRAYHNPALHAAYRPSGSRARTLFDALEELRCQSLGANALRGVAANLTAALTDRLVKQGLPRTEGTRFAALSDALLLLARERLSGEPPPEIAAGLVARWRPELEARLGDELARLAAAAHDQRSYALRAHELVRELDLGSELGPAGARSAEETAEEQVRLAGGTRAPTARESREPPAQTARIDEYPPPEEEPELATTLQPSQHGTASEGRESRQRDVALRAPPRAPPADPGGNYRAFTRAHDEIVDAERLCDPQERARLKAALDAQAKPLHGVVARLANRLQRLLLAQQKRAWRFDLEEGVLDAARLTRVVVDPVAALAFKEEAETEFKDTVVTLLIDCSGSMRGRPIMIAALCADVLARTLERCGVHVEILGFTTRQWKGGRSKDAWLAAGSPPRPGRINDLRHIVFKAADSPWRRARQNLGVMIREDLLKDNIDGEALLWAHERLMARGERRRILLVISDGVPLDESTLSVNPGSYLEEHLRAVVHFIETRSPVELRAIGIGHDVHYFYERAVKIDKAEELGGALMGQLAELFAEPEAPGRRASRGTSRARA